MNLLLDLLINPIAPPLLSLKKFTCPGIFVSDSLSLTSVLIVLVWDTLSLISVLIGLIWEVLSLTSVLIVTIFEVLSFKVVSIGFTGDSFGLIAGATFILLIYLWVGALFGDFFCISAGRGPGTLLGDVLGITVVGIGSTGDVFVLSCEKSDRKFAKLDFKSTYAISYILKWSVNIIHFCIVCFS